METKERNLEKRKKEKIRTFRIRTTKLPQPTVPCATTQRTVPDGNSLQTTSFPCIYSKTRDSEEVSSQSNAAVFPLVRFRIYHVLSDPLPSKAIDCFLGSETILQSDRLFLLVIISSNLVNRVPRCKQKQESG